MRLLRRALVPVVLLLGLCAFVFEWASWYSWTLACRLVEAVSPAGGPIPRRERPLRWRQWLTSRTI
jgi:hypothetical protein